MQPFTAPLDRIGLDVDDYPSYASLLEWPGMAESFDKLDHLTFITPHEHRQDFLDHWYDRGFSLHGEWRTERYPASHIALIRGEAEGHPWEDMIGLTVTAETESPVVRSLATVPASERSVTHTLQHIALHVRAEHEMEAIGRHLQEAGVELMTPVLQYQDPDGAELRQMFSRPQGPFFLEFVQRRPNADGKPFGGFHPRIIDDLYEALDAHIPEAR